MYELEVVEDATVHGEKVKVVRVRPEPKLFSDIHPKRVKWDPCTMLDTEGFQMVVSVNHIPMDKQQALDDTHPSFARLARSNRIRQMYLQQSIAVAVNDPVLSAWNITARHVLWVVFKRLFSNKANMTSMLRGCSRNKPGFKQLIFNMHALLPNIIFDHTAHKRSAGAAAGENAGAAGENAGAAGENAGENAGAEEEEPAGSELAVLSPEEAAKPKRMRIAQSRMHWLESLASSMEDELGRLELQESRAAEQLSLIKAEIGRGESGLGLGHPLLAHEKLLKKKSAELKQVRYNRRQIEPERKDLEEEVKQWTEFEKTKQEVRALREECLHAKREVQMKKLQASDMQATLEARTKELEACKQFILTYMRIKRLSRGTKLYARAVLGIDTDHTDQDVTTAFRSMSRMFHPESLDAMQGLDKAIKGSMKNLYKIITDAKCILREQTTGGIAT
jgi:hypothetical protein